MHKEMEKLQKEIVRLEDEFLHKTDAIKCAETRLENRSYRPGFESCEDEAQMNLRNEVLQLRKTENDLAKAIENAKYVFI